MRKRKVMSLAVVVALVMQLFAGMSITASATAYDSVGTYTNASTSVIGRYSAMTMAQIGNKMYAYVGVNSSATDGTGGLHILDVTNPSAPALVQEIAGSQIKVVDFGETGEKMFVKDGYLMIMNDVTKALEVYSIDTATGMVGSNYSKQIKNKYSNQTMKLVDKYLFVSGAYQDNPSMRIYDVTDPANATELTATTPIMPYMGTDPVTNIATYNFDVLKISNGSYRVAAYNRYKANDVNQYTISVRDVAISNGSYTVETKYEGKPGQKASVDTVKDIDFYNADILAVTYNDGNKDSCSTVEILDISAAATPISKSLSEDKDRGLSCFITDEGDILVGTQNGAIKKYVYSNDAITLVDSYETTASEVYEIGEYSGFIYYANNTNVGILEYKNEISISSTDIAGVGGFIKGVVEGYLPGTHSVVVNIAGVNVNATVSGNVFTATSSNVVTGTSATVTATLMNGETAVATDTKNVSVLEAQSVKYFDVKDLALKGSSALQTTGARVTDVIGLTIGDKKLAYVYETSGTAGTGAICVYDITDLTNVKLHQSLSGVTSAIFTDQLAAIGDDYIVAVTKKSDSTYDVDFYAIGSDGKLGTTPAASIDLGTSKQTTTIDIEGDYLFASVQGTTPGYLKAYDISNVSAGVSEVATLMSGYGAFATDVKKISDSLYRCAYIKRDNSNYIFCVTDMIVAQDGTISVETKYTDTNASVVNGNRIKDIEFIGNKVITAVGNNYIGNIVDLTNPSSPVVSEGVQSSTSVLDISENMYALGFAGKTVTVYDKTTGNALKTVNTSSGQVYGLSMYDGKLLVAAENGFFVYGDICTGISLDREATVDGDVVTITGHIDGYVSGDTVKINIGGTQVNATVTAAGLFSYVYDTDENGVVEVTAVLNRADGSMMAVTENVNVKLKSYAVNIAITSDEVTAIDGKISGIIGGDLPESYSVIVNVDGEDIVASVDNGSFVASVPEMLTTESVDVVVKVMLGEREIANVSKTLSVVSAKSVEYFNINNLTLQGSVSNTIESTRIVDVVGVSVGNKKFAYVYATPDTAGVNGAILIYDITDVNNVALVDTKVSNTEIYAEQIVAIDDYIAVLSRKTEVVEEQNVSTYDVEFYEIGNDGRLSEEPIRSIDLGTVSKTATLNVVDDYLFVSMQGTSERALKVYDVSDIERRIKFLASTPIDNGAYAADIQKISDTLYRVVYINRNETDGYQLCVADMTVAVDGSVAFQCNVSSVVLENAISVKDIEFIGNNKVYIAYGNNKVGTVVDVSTPTNLVVSEGVNSSTSVLDISENMYALGFAGKTVTVYDKTTGKALKTVNTSSGQVYGLSMYDGKLLVAAEKGFFVYGDICTGISLDREATVDGDVVTITGHIDGYVSGDTVKINIGGTQVNATVTAAGLFSYVYDTDENGVVEVTAVLNRADGSVMAVTENVVIDFTVPSEFPYFKVVSATKNSNGHIVVTVQQLCDYDGVVDVYVATYNIAEHRLSDCYIDTGVVILEDGIAVIETDIEYNSQTEDLKVFIWDENIAPLAEVGTPIVADVNQVF